MMTILALDLGKFNSVACRFDPASGRHAFQTVATTPATIHDLLIDAAAPLLVIEACSICGWIADLAESLGIEVRVANTRGEAWTWKKVKRKTDRDDALKLARLAATDQLPVVHLPKLAVRQRRSLIKYRHALIDSRVPHRSGPDSNPRPHRPGHRVRAAGASGATAVSAAARTNH